MAEFLSDGERENFNDFSNNNINVDDSVNATIDLISPINSKTKYEDNVSGLHSYHQQRQQLDNEEEPIEINSSVSLNNSILSIDTTEQSSITVQPTPDAATIASTTDVATNNASTDAITATAAVEETDEQRQLREERESQELAWELMRQEQQEMYSMQMQFMQQNASAMSEEDRLLMEQLVQESNQVGSMYSASSAFEQQLLSNIPQQQQQQQRQQQRHRQHGAVNDDTIDDVDDDNAAEEDEEASEEENAADESGESNWDYDRLLNLGEVLGDVKTERWRLRSAAVYQQLPRVPFIELVTGNKRTNTAVAATIATAVATATGNKKVCIRADHDSNIESTATAVSATTTAVATALPECRCIVCMDDFCSDDVVVLLPCQHFFHQPCTEGWLQDHNSCPMCKRAVVSSP